MNKKCKMTALATMIMILFFNVSLLVCATEKQETVQTADGSYQVQVDLKGGSGRASVTSPAKVTVSSGQGTALIEWSSPNYDYMLVNGEKFLPINTEGNSTFEIPVLVWDKEMEVVADTTAMSVPHEVTYTLLFHSESLKSGNSVMSILVQIAIVVVAAVLARLYLSNKKRKH